MEFHISRTARDRYQFDKSIFSLNGNVILANFHAARIFAQKMNQKRDLIHYPEKSVKAGQINALGLIDEILHFVFLSYRHQKNPSVLVKLDSHLVKKFGQKTVDHVLAEFCGEFPPVAVYTREMSVETFLSESSDGVSNRLNTLEEIILLWVTNKNPAAVASFQELFDEHHLDSATKYSQILKEVYEFFATQPVFGPENQNLIDMFRAPSIAVPNSLPGQLEYIRSRWGILLGKYLYRLLSSLDLLREEEKLAFAGPGETQVPVFSRALLDSEHEQYSADREWMPRLVLLAKNTLVWLDQLSKKYKTTITRLDQIPDEELDLLACRGFTGLWLIGLWERSRASAQIKQMCGNPDAVSSAYSLARYDIANEIGGYEAYENLRNRAWQRGIRLASDMVPNHMAIDSDWVIHNPDRFLALPYSPFPAYSFNGPDLSPDPRVEIKIEDHYYDRTDAAVVFRRIDRSNGDTRFIYHGNDGTSMPWNDTAQLNYLNPEVREAVIQTILDVARKFPIIRFDAAMTLARRHFQRLWFPEPGSGGDIPSRAEHGLPRDAFLAAMPQEFWREVVDRVAKEAPDTLLLAEAFWLMEGYFVRTLGMHRVYNSAFMNMLRDEENAKFRQLIKNTLEFDPEILRRYVNFISNPDERTAVDQFGKGDKYFGVCTLMATLPGLPMFGHGQIEGYTEKYGMEYKRAYYDEQPDQDLINRHEREIFPIVRKRSLFAGIENFYLYNFFDSHGQMDENVIVFTNGLGGDRVLVAYHNKFAETSGWIKTSCAFTKKTNDGRRQLVQISLMDGLNLDAGENRFIIFRDQNSGLEFIRPSIELRDQGLFLQMRAYTCQVFTDFRQVEDTDYHHYRQLCETLHGEGVPSINDSLQEILLQAVLHPLQEILNPGYLSYLNSQIAKPNIEISKIKDEARVKMRHLVLGALSIQQTRLPVDEMVEETARQIEMLLELPNNPPVKSVPGADIRIKSGLLIKEDTCLRLSLIVFAFIAQLGKTIDTEDIQSNSISLFDEWKIGRFIQKALDGMGLSKSESLRVLKLVRVLISIQEWMDFPENYEPTTLLQYALANSEVQNLLNVNRYREVLWFSKEGFTDLLNCLLLSVVFEPGKIDSSIHYERMIMTRALLPELQTAAGKSEFQVEKLIQALEDAVAQKA
ncbi:MAG: alpha-amylase [Leptolinea sp.]|jgi:glycosidase|nr:alpha-amylase [Leptolinea sp.]